MHFLNAKLCGLVFCGLTLCDLRAEMVIVDAGQAKADIVTADQPGPVAKYAAEELAIHIEKATGVRLNIISEGAPVDTAVLNHIYIGDSKAAQATGIVAGALAAEAFVMRASEHKLFIVGNDKRDDPLDPDTRAGTLWGVYEWLERTLHVRWVWPGELGTFVPKATRVVAADGSETIAPRFFQRKIRPGLGFISDHPALGFTAAAFEQYSREQSVFMRRHRMGRSIAMSNGHAFVEWWKTYGKEHPEWFQLRTDGKRGPKSSTSRFSMCVSNPDFQREIIAQWAAKHDKKSIGPSFINACENDVLGQCACGICQALDGPAPEGYLKYYSPTSKMATSRFVSDRYAHFWLSLQQQAAQIDPHATVVGYVYFNYFQAPTTEVKLNDHVLLGYCPSGGWFPRSPDEHAWMKAQWDGWRKTGAQLFLRTNYLLDGYCMPFIFAHQFADDFQHAVRNGLVATDLDSLTGQWATQGPNLYVATRLHVQPEASADALLAEYYSAFGAAAPEVKAYFEYWETFTTTHREQTNAAMEKLQASRWRTWAKAAHVVFPSSSFDLAEALLDRAANAVRDDKEASARVEFLHKGLIHAKLCTRIGSELSLANPSADGPRTQALLHELITFRRENERSGISNFNHDAWVEDLSWKLSDDTKKAPDLYP